VPTTQSKPHLRLRKTAVSRSYKAVTQGGDNSKVPQYPNRSRLQHGQNLVAALNALEVREAEVEARRASAGVQAQGTTIAVDISQNPDFSVASLEDARAGIELLAVKRQMQDKSVAAVFVPLGRIDNPRRKVEHYLDPSKDSEKEAPKNAPLVASIDSFRAPTAVDLWTDPVYRFPDDLVATHWWEIWVRGTGDLDAFSDQARRLGVEIGPQRLRFPERTVVVAAATIEAMERAVELLDRVAELRAAPRLDADFHTMDAHEQGEWVQDLAGRLLGPDDDGYAVCLLDTGIAWGHPLLEPIVSPDDCLAYDGWSPADVHGHGTWMAGIAAFGEELAAALVSSDDHKIPFVLESVKVLEPSGGHVNADLRLRGEIFQSAVALIEIERAHRKRTFSFTITGASSHEGRPTAWSAAIDEACAGVDDAPPRLVFASAGNAILDSNYLYPEVNFTSMIEDPAQAWNAITVGAMTERVEFDRSPASGRMGWLPVAPAGDLSPESSTSRLWNAKQWPSKPDFVMEGGNVALPSSGGTPQNVDELALLTTELPELTRLNPPLTAVRGTSPAAVLGARLAAEVWREYPDLWSETIRALLVHSSRWTDEMQARCTAGTPRENAKDLLRTYGYGVPSRKRALHSAGNALTMIVEDSIQPYKLVDGVHKTNELRLHRLPWPDEALEELAQAKVNVRLRVTLSYFIEPNPGERGWSGRYRYASHGLRFAVRTADETDAWFEKRINKAARESGEKGFHSDAKEWVIGPDELSTGSIHSDVWSGTGREAGRSGTRRCLPRHRLVARA
jgi:hypothetical protein